MPITINVMGTDVDFPDDASQKQIEDHLNSSAFLQVLSQVNPGAYSSIQKDQQQQFIKAVGMAAPAVAARAREFSGSIDDKPVNQRDVLGITSPANRQRQDEDTARAADFVRNDLPNVVKSAPALFKSGIQKSIGGIARFAAEDTSGGEGTVYGEDAAREGFGILGDPQALKQWGTDQAEAATAAEKQTQESYPVKTYAGQITQNSVTSIGQQLPGVAAAASGFPEIGLPLIGVQTFGQTYADSRARGMSPEDAVNNASIQSAAEIGTEIAPFSLIAKGMKGGISREVLKDYFLKEQIGEHVATAIQNASDVYFDEADPAKRLDKAVDYWFSRKHGQDQIDTFWTTLIQSSLMGGAGKVANVAKNKISGALSKAVALHNPDEWASVPAIDNGAVAAPGGKQIESMITEQQPVSVNHGIVADVAQLGLPAVEAVLGNQEDNVPVPGVENSGATSVNLGTAAPQEATWPEMQKQTAAAVLPADNLPAGLRNFIDRGAEYVASSGEKQFTWDRPMKPPIDKAVRDFLEPALQSGTAVRNGDGAYLVETDRGALRVVPPADPLGSYRVEYHSPTTKPIIPFAGPVAGDVAPLIQEPVDSDVMPVERNTWTPAQSFPLISRENVEAAFPRQTVSETDSGFTVNLKNGAVIKVQPGEVLFDRVAAEAAHSRTFAPDERPVASFRKLDNEGLISLADNSGAAIDHETFHAAMSLALNEKQRGEVLKRYGSEEAAAAAYQRLKENGSFEQKGGGNMFLRMVYRFANRINAVVNPSSAVLADVASGKAWEPAGVAGGDAPMYSFGKDKDVADPGRLRAAKESIDSFTDKSAFVKDDVKPALRAIGDGLAAASDGIKAAANPMERSEAAEEAGRILIEGMGWLEHDREQFITKLNRATFTATVKTSQTARALDLLTSSQVLADKAFNSMPEEERIAFMQNMDIGQAQATPELQQIADVIKGMFREKVEAVQLLGTGALENVREAYFPHAWRRGDDAAKEINSRLSKRPLEGGKGFVKGRVFEDVLSGIDAGFEPISSNPLDLVFLKMAEMDKYINAHTALQAMEDSGLVELIPAGEGIPGGYADIAGRYGLVTKKGFVDPESGETEVKSYRYVAREDVAQIFNNYLSENLYNNKYIGKPFTWYMRAANTLNQFQLGVFSAFHAGFTSMEAVISHGALGIKALSRGDYSDAAKFFKQAPVAWYLNPKLGDKVLKAWMGDPAAAKEMPQAIEWLQLAGARKLMDNRFHSNATQRMLQAWANGNKAAATLRGVEAIVEQSARPIMEWLVPRQKFGVFAEMAHDWASRHPNATHEDIRKEMQQIWNRVDSRLGQVVYDRLFVHNVAKNLTQAIIRAPGWTGGTILEVGGGIKDLIGHARKLGKKAELTDRAAYTLSLLVTTAVTNAVLTALFTGEPPKDWKDLIAFRTGKMDEHGNPERMMLPTYLKDIYAYAGRPGTTLLHKAHPMLSLIGDLVRNRDFYNTEIRHPGDNPILQLAQVAGFTVKVFIPFWMKGVAKEYEQGGSVLSMAAPLFGVMPAPADLNRTAAEKLARELMVARMPQGVKTQKQFEQRQLINQLTSRVRNKVPGVFGEVGKAVRTQKISHEQGRQIYQNAKKAPLLGAVEHLSYDETKRVYEVANEKEKKLLRIILSRKRQKALTSGRISG